MISKLFRIASGKVAALVGATETIEKSLQTLLEQNLEACLGVRFLASEFATTHSGRIDTLGLDENGCPVILEYKRAMNENVISQGLFYLDWLMDGDIAAPTSRVLAMMRSASSQKPSVGLVIVILSVVFAACLIIMGRAQEGSKRHAAI